MSESSGDWSETTLAGHPCDVYQPPEMNKYGFVVVYLHGVHLGRLRDQPVFTELFRKHSLPVVAPMTQRSWWTDIVCEEFDAELTAERHLLDNVLPYIEQRWETKPPRIGLLGTSMGGQGALRFAYKYPELFPVVSAISPAIDYYRYYDVFETIPQMYSEPEAARQDSATLRIHPMNWTRHQFFCCDPADEHWHDSAERLQMKLYSLGIPHKCDLETTVSGHGFDYYNIMAEKAVKFIADSLERERLRVA